MAEVWNQVQLLTNAYKSTLAAIPSRSFLCLLGAAEDSWMFQLDVSPMVSSSNSESQGRKRSQREEDGVRGRKAL